MDVTINGRNVRFEVVGDDADPPMVFTGGGFFPLDYSRVPCKALADQGWRVVNWDRPGSGGSDFDFDADSLLRSWADALDGLLEHLGIQRCVVGGGSGGCVTSLAYAHYYPARVTALVCKTPHTDDPELMAPVRQNTFFEPIRVVEKHGMAGLVDLETGFFEFADQIRRFPRKRQALSEMSPDTFIDAMHRWSAMTEDTSRAFLANLTDEELGKLVMPSLVFAPFVEQPAHPRHTAEILAKLLPNSTYLDWEEYFGDRLPSVRQKLEDNGGGNYETVLMAPAIDSYLRKMVGSPR